MTQIPWFLYGVSFAITSMPRSFDIILTHRVVNVTPRELSWSRYQRSYSHTIHNCHIWHIRYIIYMPFITDFCDQNIIIRELKILCIAHIFFFFLKTNVSLPYWWPGQRTALSPRLGPLPCPWVGNYPGWPVILAQHERVHREDELLSFCHIVEHDYHSPWSSATFLIFILSVS